MFKAVLSLPRTVWFVGLISLVNDSASEMIYPLVPLYLAPVLMAGPRALSCVPVLGRLRGACRGAAAGHRPGRPPRCPAGLIAAQSTSGRITQPCSSQSTWVMPGSRASSRRRSNSSAPTWLATHCVAWSCCARCARLKARADATW